MILGSKVANNKSSDLVVGTYRRYLQKCLPAFHLRTFNFVVNSDFIMYLYLPKLTMEYVYLPKLTFEYVR